MRVQILTLALFGALIALPVPASQFLAGSVPAASGPARIANVLPGTANLATLMADPFLIDQLSYAAPASFIDTRTGIDPHDI